MDISKENQQSIATYWNNGHYEFAQRRGNNWYGVDENGNPVKLNQALLHFANRNYENPLIAQTRKFIAKREEDIEMNENAIVSFKNTYEKIKENLGKYLTSIGVKNGETNESLNGIQRMRVNDFEYKMSKINKSINLAKMSIMGDLMSNFSDYCSIMKMS